MSSHVQTVWIELSLPNIASYVGGVYREWTSPKIKSFSMRKTVSTSSSTKQDLRQECLNEFSFLATLILTQ
ncbi:Hypothetical protein FKW44_007890 [Caligus rogercresseyi]|uniref:Uncharacterized protein n=1 Tax=Caligus rogercresseyi TaxID=217165 RepID=A0A7T8KFC9_CALRO|nr:Hypothetical protein FKW44_007890 [Caligus rogercresseyi]